MKATITMVTLAAALCTQLSFGRAGIPLPFGSKQKIVHIADLPDQKEFQMADGRYFDIGSHYEIDHVLWLAYRHSTPRLIGYLGNSDEYVVLTPDALKAIEKAMNDGLEAKAEVSFMDKIGGKIILGFLALLGLYGIYTSYFSKVPKGQEEESIVY